MEDRFFLHLAEFISLTLAPVQEKINGMEDRITGLENNFAVFEEIIKENKHQTMELKSELEKLKTNSIMKKEEPVVIREIRVDKILLDKYEQNNSFGNLGIKELSGQLNIGATYGSSTLPAEIAEDLKADFESFKQENEDNDLENTGEESSAETSEESSWESSVEPGERFSEHQDVGEQNPVIDDDDDFTEISIE